MTDKNRLQLNAPMIVDFEEHGKLDSDKALLILHGYGQNIDIIKEQLGENIYNHPDYHIIIANGCFPIPKVRSDHVLYRFAWYFYDRFESRYFIDFTTPKNILNSLITELAPKKDLTIIGYSQGGYLAPFVGEMILKTKKVIGVNCKFRQDLLGESLDYDLFHLHGENDKLVEYKPALESFNILKKRVKGSCKHLTIKNTNHDISNELIEELLTLL